MSDPSEQPADGSDGASLPLILVVEPGGAAEAAAATMRDRFGTRFEVATAASAEEAARTLEALHEAGGMLALLLAAESAAYADDGALLARAGEHFPDARRMVYGARQDADAGSSPEGAPAPDACMPWPWEAPDVTLVPVACDLLEDWRPRTAATPTVRVIGFQWSPHAHEVKDFLARNRVSYVWLDVERSAEARAELERSGIGNDDLPAVLFPDGPPLLAPDDTEIAERIGLRTEAESPFYDLIIVGGGPSGLAAAVYGASEGLRTLIVEGEAPGGQAGQSARIENYLGFPDGLSGSDLAQRAVAQANKFGVEILAAREVRSLRTEGQYRIIGLDDGDEIAGHTVLLATGVSWLTLEAPGCRDLIGAGVYYGAASAEAQSFRDQDVYLLGGGNSAGQAAMLLSRYARSVTILSLEESLDQRMSSYLLDKIEATENIHARPCCTVDRAEGKGRLENITIRNVNTEESETVAANGLFVFIGAAPRTEWLEGVVARDDDGYILCGAALRENGRAAEWPLERSPFLLETSVPGVFVAGDARAGSVKRVGAAVGEGSMAIQFIHEYLRER